MHQCKSIYMGKIVISNQVKIRLKSKSMDYVDVWQFQTKSGLSQYVYNVENIARSL